MPLDLSVARVTATAGLPEDRQVFVIKARGTRIGELSSVNGVWAAQLVLGLNDVVTYRNKSRDAVLALVKMNIGMELEKRECMGFVPGEQVLYRDEAMFIIIGTDPKHEKLFLGYTMGGEVRQEAHPTDLN